MKNFNKLALAVLLALSPVVNAGTIVTEDEAQDLSILIAADLVASYKVSISNADMDDSSITSGTLNLTPASLDAAKSVAAVACKDPADVTLVYSGNTTCSVNAGASVSTSSASFTADFDVLVEIAGPGSIDLAMTLDGNVSSDSAFANSAASFSSSSGASSLGLVDQSTDVLTWGGDMNFNEGPTFEETIQIDVVKN